MLKTQLKQAAAIGTVLAVGLGATAHGDSQTAGKLKKDGTVWLVQASGKVCKVGVSTDLTSSTCLNASLVRVENHAYTSGVGGKVNARLYYNQAAQNGGRSAYACISPQDVWKKGPGGVTVHFNQLAPAGAGKAGTGYGKAIWRDVARVQFTSAKCV